MAPHGQIKARDSLSTRLRQALAASRSYAKFALQLGQDIFSKFPAEIVRVLAAGSGALACQVLAVATVFTYVSTLENNGLILGFDARDSLALFAFIGLATTCLLGSFIFLEYTSDTLLLKICREYQHMGTREALYLASNLPHWFADKDPRKLTASQQRKLLTVDVQHRSRMGRTLIGTLIPCIRLVVCGAALAYINALFSLLVFAVISVPMIGLVIVGKKVANTVTAAEGSSESVFKSQHDVLASSWQTGSPLMPDGISWELAMGQADSNIRLYYRRLKAKALGRLLISVANAVGLTLLVLSLGLWVLLEPTGDWSIWLTYLVALRYFLSSITRVAQAALQAARFSRQAKRFMAFISAGRRTLKSKNSDNFPCPAHVISAYRTVAGGDAEFDED